MSAAARHGRGPLAAAIAIAAYAYLPGGPLAPARAGAAPEPATETRALWVLRTSLGSPDSIATLVRSAREHGFNTLLVQVRGRGDSYYRGGVEPRPAELARQPDFDPLASVLTAGHAAGLRVHAWVNVNLVSSAADLPAAREHLIYRHPSWLMVPRDIAQDLAAENIDSPAYVGKLARWTRAQPSEIEGLYSTPIAPAAAAYTTEVVEDLVRRYAVDGVHFDYARYPTERFDYSRDAIREFRAAVRDRLPLATRRALDAQEVDDLFAYPDGLQDQWRGFRIERMTGLIRRMSAAVRRARPHAVLSVAVSPDLRDASDRRLQDWGAWLDAGLIDALCPMAYTEELERFAGQIAAARHAAGTREVWAGIGAWRLTPGRTIENIQTARRLGAAGVVLFSYDSLTNPRQTVPDYLALVGRGAFAATSTTAGSR
ncbi:MAG: hypothetical protein A3H96_01225 [Acidobacteria bacterium RIFCSPLOWO2_02_FULL_67_36]|nr:MAG: hypothetical protein A3H96_01225 [Acidobacteria bacterium RIFCSPLOWO2_02_FULL_67_36]OFW18671.1 MAG: hypothetical protein A3G21_25705 [Acidobacteria bacterium RIFCSPLOWO2_12_FULL_66_21]